MHDRAILNVFAELVSYPHEGVCDTADRLGGWLKQRHAAVYDAFEPFQKYIREARFAEIEECFTYSFDLNAAACLEVGWHLYGEDYRRGQFLAQMRQCLMQHHIEESQELPDHLSHCLKAAAILNEADTHRWVYEQLNPVIRKIRLQIGEDNPYRALLSALHGLLQHWYGDNGRQLPSADQREAWRRPEQAGGGQVSASKR